MGQDPAAEETFVIPKELRHIMATLKGHAPIPDDQIVPVPEDKAFPVTAARRKTEEEALKNLQSDQLMPDGTIYLGRYSPTDCDGNSLSMTFNVFAAPQDLPETMKYVDAVKHIAKLKNWHGFEGTNYTTDKEIYAALKDGSYNGGWIIPTLDILLGWDVGGKKITPDNLYAHRDKFNVAGDPKRAFNTTGNKGSDSDFPDWYWSSTEDRDSPFHVWAVQFSDDDGGWSNKDLFPFSCRPVRLVPA